jgi:voltage-gated potassium channel
MAQGAYENLKNRVWEVLNDADSAGYRWFHAFINTLIVSSVAIVVFEVFANPSAEELEILRTIDAAILVVFLIEFLGRLWVIRDWRPKVVRLTWSQKVGYWIASRMRFILSPWGLIDFVALLPLFPFLRSLRILRLLRLARSVQFFRYANPVRTLTAAFRDNSLLFTVSTLFVVVSVGLSAVMLFLAEYRVNDNIETLGDTLWWAIVTITTVGFGDITPVTTGGRVIASALMFSGMFIIAMFAGVISSTLVGHLLPLKMEQVRMSSVSDHIVVAGWNARVPIMLEEMVTEYGNELPRVIVFAPRDRPVELDEQFLFVNGDFTHEREFDKVRLAYARTVVVVASDVEVAEHPQKKDATTVLTVFTIRAFEKKLSINRRSPIHLVAEVLESENCQHARVAGADEVIETYRLGSSLLAHTAGNPGVGSVVTNLMLASHNNVYAGNLPAELVEGEMLVFEDVQELLRREYGILVVGVVHKDEMELNPPPQTEVFAGDRIVYIGPRKL